MTRLLFALAFVGACFPYICFPIHTPSDLQANSLVYVAFFLIIYCRTFFKMALSHTFLLGLSFNTAILAFSLIKSSLTGEFDARVLFSYQSFLIFYVFGGMLCYTSPKRIVCLIAFVALTWFVVGGIQHFFKRDFMYFLLNSPRTSTSRGVVGLSSEPSMYGFSCLLLILLNVLIRRAYYKVLSGPNVWLSRVTETVLLIQIFFFSKSTSSLIVTIFSYVLLLSIQFPKTLFWGLLASIFITNNWSQSISRYFMASGQDGSRLQQLASKLFHDPTIILYRDQSAGERVTDAFLSFYSFLFDFPWSIGWSYSSWINFARSNFHEYSFLTHLAMGSRIMSGFGSPIFDLGWIGCLYILLFVLILTRGRAPLLAIGFTLLTLLNFSISLALPLLGIIVGFSLNVWTHNNPKASDNEKNSTAA